MVPKLFQASPPFLSKSMNIYKKVKNNKTVLPALMNKFFIYLLNIIKIKLNTDYKALEYWRLPRKPRDTLWETLVYTVLNNEKKN